MEVSQDNKKQNEQLTNKDHNPTNEEEQYVTESIILLYPDPRLRNVSKPWDETYEEMGLLRDLFKDLSDQNNSITLVTGPNVGLFYRIMYVRTDQYTGVIVNPVFVPDKESGKCGQLEGCLSMPAIVEKITRYKYGYLRGFDENGDRIEFDCGEELARTAQAGIDYLDGKLFIERVGPAKRLQMIKKYNRGEKRAKKVYKIRKRLLAMRDPKDRLREQIAWNNDKSQDVVSDE